MKKIEVDFASIAGYLEKMDTISDDYKATILEFKKTVSGIRDNNFWTGNDSDAYMETILTKYMDSFEKVSQLFQHYTRLIRTTASLTEGLEVDLSSRALTKKEENR